MAVYDAEREELVQLAGDRPDPAANVRGLEHARGLGVESTLDFTKRALGHPLIRYRDKVIEADVYALPGEPMHVHLICPRCQHALSIKADAKSIDYDPKAGDPKNGGRISIETFECTWEIEPTRGVFSLCRWRVAIDANIARDA